MTKNETLQILAILNAFYSGGKNDVKTQVHAWHLIIGKYDYVTVEQAVLHFAENDTRPYATFPAVGLIVNEIRKAESVHNGVINEITVGIAYGRSYDQISNRAQTLISENLYNEWLSMNAVEYAEKSGTLKQILQQKQKQLTNDRPN